MPLKRHKALISLSHDHHHGLILAQLIKKDAPPYKDLPQTIPDKADYTIKFYNSELLKHFHEEENILYPFIAGKDNELDKLSEEIFAEHKQMSIIVDLIKKKIKLADNLHELGEILSAHIRKEERVLFPKIQEVLSENEMDELGRILAAS